LLSWRWVLIPSIVGLAGLAWGALAGVLAGAAGWAGLLGLGLAAGAAGCRWLLSGETLEQQALDDLRRRAARKHVDYLKQLRRRLRRDRDPRTGKCLKRLHGTHERLDRLDARVLSLPAGAKLLAEVVAQAGQLYQSCLELLERSLVLWNTSQQLTTDDARDRLLRSRDQLLDEVDQSIGRLERTLDSLQVAAVRDDQPQDEHARLRAELDEGLAVAQRVQQRMDALTRDLPSRIANDSSMP
jgi:hypothetical protein